MKCHNFQLQGLRYGRQGEASICMKSINISRRWKGYQGARASLLPGILPSRKQIIGGHSERERWPCSFRPQVKQAVREFPQQFLLWVFSPLCQFLHPCFSTQPDSSQLSPGEELCMQEQTAKPQSYMDTWDVSQACAKAGTKQSRLVSHKPARPNLLAALRRSGTARTIRQHHHFCSVVSSVLIYWLSHCLREVCLQQNLNVLSWY